MVDLANEGILFLEISSDLLLLLLAIGDIHDRREHHGAVINLDWVETDLHRKLAPVLSDAIEVAPCAHWPCLVRTGEE